MKLLVTGKGGHAGSWVVRGEQLGEALGATVQPVATNARRFDCALVVKRVPDITLAAIRAARIPWVFDAVDFYPQPAAYGWSCGEASTWVRKKLTALKPSAVIWPNQRMREDCDTGLPGLVLPHHHRPGIAANPIRERVQTVGYEGAPAYLGRWGQRLQAECGRRGWRFVVNPKRLADVDIVIAMRDGGGYVSRHWKSNIKLANAHGSGTPFVGQAECGYLETATGAEYWAEDEASLATAFDWLESQGAREAVSDRFLQRAFPVEHAAADLGAFLRGL